MICTTCKIDKSLDDFSNRKNSKKRKMCKSCLYSYQMKRWNKRKIRAIEYLGDKCKNCGLKDHPCVFDFHHRDTSIKDVGWTKLRLRSWDKIKKELDKCDLLCSHCHRKRHLNQELWPNTPARI